MNSSSKIDINQVFKQLANIKEVEPSANLYSYTLHRLNRNNVIPLFWVGAVACLTICFIASEYYVFETKKSDKKDVANYVSITNNILYNE